jgi:hypothetical protein
VPNWSGRESSEMSNSTERMLSKDNEQATKANLEMDRLFNGGDDGGETPAEAVDVPQMFRNES